jgi:uncharacterized protein YbjT (DUF2867 family)
VAESLELGGFTVRRASRTGTDVTFDWTDDSTWRDALGESTRVFVMAPDGVEVEPRFVKLAVARGAERLVLLSSKAIELMNDERLLAAERTIRNSGVEWTIVRADWFNQNFDEGFLHDQVVAGEVAMPLGELEQAFIDASDIAAVIAVALTEDGHGGETYELSGPRNLGFGEATQIIGRELGREIAFRGDPEAFAESLGLSTEDLAAPLAAFDALRRAGSQPPNDTVRRLTGRAPKSFETYVRDAAAAGAWSEQS